MISTKSGSNFMTKADRNTILKQTRINRDSVLHHFEVIVPFENFMWLLKDEVLIIQQKCVTNFG